MDGSRFDAWTRRRWGVAAGGLAMALLGVTWPDAGSAKSKKRKRKRCSKAGRPCKGNPSCCGSLKCQVSGEPTRLRCCRGDGKPCANGNQCCGDLLCSEAGLCTLPSSDRALKANFGTVDAADMLARVAALPITTWNYRSDDATVRHIGPMAQDFAATFGVGADDRHIHPLDGQGVALAAIQGLLAQIETLQATQARLTARLEALERGNEGDG